MTAPTLETDRPRTGAGSVQRQATPRRTLMGEVLHRADRIIGRMSLPVAVLVLTALVAGFAAVVAFTSWILLFDEVRYAIFPVAAAITTVLSAPIIAHAQKLIRTLDRSKRELRVLAEDLARARDAAEAANRAKSRLLASVSHELRTPLNAVIGFSSLLADRLQADRDDADSVDFAREIENAGHNLLRTVNAILDFVRLEDLGGAGATEATDLCRVVESVWREFAPTAEQRKLRVALELANVPDIEANPSLLRQMIWQLLSNAVKFAPDGGRVVVRVEQRGACVLLAVRDNGPGMADEEVRAALTAFAQIGDVLSRVQGGIGIGLPLARRIAEAHGGELGIASQAGTGTEVTVHLPLRSDYRS